MRICTELNCGLKHYAKGVCRKHWKKLPHVRAKEYAWAKAHADKVKVYSKKSNRQPMRRYGNAKARAKQRGLEFSLSFEQWYALIKPNVCTYCGGILGETMGGLDRMDNAHGYTPNNSVPCCGICNDIKGENLSYTEMLEVARLLKRLRNSDQLIDV